MDAIEFEFVGEKRDEQGSTLFPNVSGVSSTTCELAASRDATAATEVVALREDDLIEVETSDGAWLLTRHQFLALTNLDSDGFQLDAAGNRSGDATGKPRLPLAVQFDDGKRGIISWTLKALRILNIDLAGFLVKKVAEAIDGSLVHNDQPGLYAVGRDGEMTSAAISSGTEPVLLLVHGTGSATLRAFGNLIPNNQSTAFQKAPWQTIHDAFNGRVFAFEHPTLTVPVAENALALLSVLPSSECPPLVILSHSRGGLVSDVLTSVQHPENHDEKFLEALQQGASGEDRDDSDEVEKPRSWQFAKGCAARASRMPCCGHQPRGTQHQLVLNGARKTVQQSARLAYRWNYWRHCRSTLETCSGGCQRRLETGGAAGHWVDETRIDAGQSA